MTLKPTPNVPVAEPAKLLTPSEIDAVLEDALARVSPELSRHGGDVVPRVRALGREISICSWKTAARMIECSPGIIDRAGPEVLDIICRIGMRISRNCWATASALFEKAPGLIDRLTAADGRERVPAVFHLGEQLCHGSWKTAARMLDMSPAIIRRLGMEGLNRITQIGMEIAPYSWQTATANFEKSPGLIDRLLIRCSREQIMAVLDMGVDMSRYSWQTAGCLLEHSPALLERLGFPGLEKIAGFTADIARQSWLCAVDIIEKSPRLIDELLEFGDQAQAADVYGQCADVAALCRRTALHLLDRSPALIGRVGYEGFGLVVRKSRELAKKAPDRAISFISGESEEGSSFLSAIAESLELAAVKPVLANYLNALLRYRIEIVGAMGHATDGRTLFLPERLGNFAEKEKNFLLYKIYATHEQAHLEHGSFDFTIEKIGNTVEYILARYPDDRQREGNDTDRFFALFPEPAMAKDIFNILEDFRIESRLKEEYPVLGDQITEMNRHMADRRPAMDHLAGDKQRTVEIIGQVLFAGLATEAVSPSIARVADPAVMLAKSLASDGSDIHDTARITARIYCHIDDAFEKDQYRPVIPFSAFIDPQKTDTFHTELGGRPDPSGTRPDKEPTDKTRRPTEPDDDTDAKNVVPVGNPEDLPDNTPAKQREKTYHFSELPDFSSDKPARDSRDQGNQPRSKRISFGDDGAGSRDGKMMPDVRDFPGSDHSVFRFSALSTAGKALSPAPGSHLYPEWGEDIGGYRINWTRVVERPLSGGSEVFYRDILKKYAPLVKKVKREFQMLRPEGMTRLKRQVDGEEIDIDAAVEYFIDRKMGITPSEKNYVRTKKNRRDIAVAFLVDMSGSTRGATIDLEKESLIIMSEALEELGDVFAVYGFSGHTRERVDFFIIKDFTDPYNETVARRISAIRDHHGTRIGAAVRHAHTRLKQRDEKIKLLILLSDGKPEDREYDDAYGIEDTRMALKEGGQKGIRSFCITVDDEAPEYLHRMYSHSNWVVIDDVGKLPWKITRIYRQLTT